MTNFAPKQKFTLAVDSHIHIYNQQNLTTILDSAQFHFDNALIKQKSNPGAGVLILTEPNTKKSFQMFTDLIKDNQKPTSSTWEIQPTNEPYSLKTVESTGKIIFIIAGQQIITRENLEVLAFPTLNTLDNDQSLQQTIAAIIKNDCLPILPWGVGKWLSSRGKIILDFINNNPDQTYFLGDNGGRPGLWKNICQFQLAKQKKIRILRGSDSLPLNGNNRMPGSYGFTLFGPFDPEFPAESLKNLLLSPDQQIADFGRHETFFHFLSDQIALHLNKKS